LLHFQIDPKLTPATPGAEGVLANFFNSLLHKKSGSWHVDGGASGGGASPAAAATACLVSPIPAAWPYPPESLEDASRFANVASKASSF